MRHSVDLATPATEAILRGWRGFEWTTQGFGMIRTYLDANKQWRLNVWDDRCAVPGVSTIHDHPWSFTSYVIAGELRNQRYALHREGDMTHEFWHIETGEEGGPQSRSHIVGLDPLPLRVYRAGECYEQELTEVHETSFLRGTVTLNDRTPATKEHTARVFWPIGQKWVDAKPRLATDIEVEHAVKAALLCFALAGCVTVSTVDRCPINQKCYQERTVMLTATAPL